MHRQTCNILLNITKTNLSKQQHELKNKKCIHRISPEFIWYRPSHFRLCWEDAACYQSWSIFSLKLSKGADYWSNLEWPNSSSLPGKQESLIITTSIFSISASNWSQRSVSEQIEQTWARIETPGGSDWGPKSPLTGGSSQRHIKRTGPLAVQPGLQLHFQHSDTHTHPAVKDT